MVPRASSISVSTGMTSNTTGIRRDAQHTGRGGWPCPPEGGGIESVKVGDEGGQAHVHGEVASGVRGVVLLNVPPLRRHHLSTAIAPRSLRKSDSLRLRFNI